MARFLAVLELLRLRAGRQQAVRLHRTAGGKKGNDGIVDGIFHVNLVAPAKTGRQSKFVAGLRRLSASFPCWGGVGGRMGYLPGRILRGPISMARA